MFENSDVDLEGRTNITVSESVPVITSFKKMGLKPELLRGIYSYGIIYFLIICIEFHPSASLLAVGYGLILYCSAFHISHEYTDQELYDSIF